MVATGSSRSHTSPAASRVAPPTNTDSRRNAARSSGLSRSWLHAKAARSVRCRWGTSRAVLIRMLSRWRSRKVSSPGVKSLRRAAASSNPSGSPSSRAQISASAARLSGVTVNSGSNRRTHCTSISTAGAVVGPSRSSSPGSPSGRTGISRSARRCSRSRLVISSVSPGIRRAPQPVQARRRAGVRSCRRRGAWSCRPAPGRADRLPPPCRRRRSRPPPAPPQRPGGGSRTSVRSTNATPSGKREAAAAATAIASRVLPTPGGPVSVSSRVSGSASSRSSAATSSSRPTSASVGVGSERRSRRAGGPPDTHTSRPHEPSPMGRRRRPPLPVRGKSSPPRRIHANRGIWHGRLVPRHVPHPSMRSREFRHPRSS